MTQALAPCPSCSRHVNTSEAACPFCKSALPTLTALPGPTHRLGRAAAYAFTASLVVAGCTTGNDPNFGDGGGSESGGGDGSVNDAAKDGTVRDDGSFQPPYGVPAYGLPPFDAGITDSGNKG